ncbi:unnamed protein product [Cladocopium goreaui]|uniref:BTB domain-containing protein n=1 Tax=Cladocopium goreaui TaxID=2562237 RepID=A0A9P1GU62_9DINO|nr:unnamed protein product [Cladocopium goreaui]
MDGTLESNGLPFRGVLENLPTDLLIGWTVHYHDAYSAPTRAQDLVSLPQGNNVLVAATNADSDDAGLNLDVSACGKSDAVTTLCARWQTTAHNGVLWYLEPGKAFGFADRSELRTDRRRGADTAEGQLRVSWHLDGHGGYRAGSLECLNHDNSWRKLVFRRDIGPSATWLLPSAPGWEGAGDPGIVFGANITLRGSDGSCQVLHSCLLRCRCSALHRRIGADAEVDIPGASARSLRDLAAYIYGALLPWEYSARLEPKELLPRVLELMDAAKFMELDALQRICAAWCKLAAKADALPLSCGADPVRMDGLAQGMVVGSGLPGAVLEDDMARLLEELEDASYMEDKVTVILARSDHQEAASCSAHGLVLCARSAFFAAAMASADGRFVERGRRRVQLGIVEDLGLWRPGEDSSYVSGAFRALLHHIYTGRRQVEVGGLKGQS